eukprot:jgi/Ulvmu1/11993/UM083_0003.1
MAFQDYMNGSSMPEVSGGGHQQQHAPQQQNAGQQAAPSIVPLSLELVPPVLCQSFGVPMHNQFVQRIGYGVPDAMRQRSDMFRFGHAENYQAQHFLTEQTQMPYQPSLASIGQMGPLVYGLGNGAVGFAPQANANRVMQYNTALAQQQSQNQHQSVPQGQQQHGQQQADAPAGQPMQHAQIPSCQTFYRSPGIAVAGHGYIDPNMLRHSMMHGVDGCAETREDDGRGVKRSSLNMLGMAFGRASVMEPVKRSRLVWTPDLHQRFEEAVERAGGIDVAVPKTVLEVCSWITAMRCSLRSSRSCAVERGAANASACLDRLIPTAEALWYGERIPAGPHIGSDGHVGVTTTGFARRACGIRWSISALRKSCHVPFPTPIPVSTMYLRR